MQSSLTSELVNYIADQNRYVSLKELEKHFRVSKRTIFYRIKNANVLLAEHKISKIKNSRGVGYFLDKKSSESWQLLNHKKQIISNTNTSRNNRIKKIIWQFLIANKPLSITNLSSGCNVSRNTIINDLKFVRDKYPLLKLKSTTKGHILNCVENSKRKYLFQELQKENDGVIAKAVDNFDFPLINLNKIHREFENLECSINSRFTENAIIRLSRMLKFSAYKVFLGDLVKTSDISKKETYFVSEAVINNVEKLLKINGIYDNNEILFFCELVLCSQAESVNFITDNFKEKMIDTTKSIIYRYNQISSVNIVSDKLVLTLSNHLYATYFRCKFGFEFEADSLITIEKKFPEMIKFVELSCRPLAKLIGHPIPLNEIALICLYFISYDGISNDISDFLNRTDDIKAGLKSDVLLVCTNGLSFSTILYSTLHKKYPLINFSKSLNLADLEKIMRIPNKAKLIITTSPLNIEEFDIPVIQIHSLMNTKDSYKVEQILKKIFPQLSIDENKFIQNLFEIIKKNTEVKDEKALKADLASYLYPYSDYKNEINNKLSLLDLILPKNIKVFNNSHSLITIIKILCKALQEDNIVTQDYISDITELINQYGPYMLMSSNTFLAHAAPSSHTKKVGLAIGILSKPIRIEVNHKNEYISCVILLSPGYHHEHDMALAQLINLIGNKNVFKELLAAKNSNLGYRIIRMYYKNNT